MKQSKMIDDLEAAFGTQDARVLAALAVYAMCTPGVAMENFTSWLGGYIWPASNRSADSVFRSFSVVL